jgi:hypothetical protein
LGDQSLDVAQRQLLQLAASRQLRLKNPGWHSVGDSGTLNHHPVIGRVTAQNERHTHQTIPPCHGQFRTVTLCRLRQQRSGAGGGKVNKFERFARLADHLTRRQNHGFEVLGQSRVMT